MRRGRRRKGKDDEGVYKGKEDEERKEKRKG
jgi:hypothetical protein